MNAVNETGTCEKTPMPESEPVTYEGIAEKLTNARLSVELVTHILDKNLNRIINT